MLRRCLPLLTALVFAVGGVNAFRLPPRTTWGDVYSHVPNHLVTAGTALLVGVGLWRLGRLGATERARRASTLAGASWGLVSAVFVVDAVGGGIGDRTGDYAVHDAAMLLLPVAGLLLLTSTVLLLVTAGVWSSWRMRLAAVASAPGTLALNEASSTLWLALSLVAAAAWLALAAAAVRSDRPAQAVADPAPVQPSRPQPLLDAAAAVPGADAQAVAGDGGVHDLVDVDPEPVGGVLGPDLHRPAGHLRLP